jgi:hypothetical protein
LGQPAKFAVGAYKNEVREWEQTWAWAIYAAVKTQLTAHILHFLVSPPHRVVPKAGSTGVLIRMDESDGEGDEELVDVETCIRTPCCGRYREHLLGHQ